MGRCGLQLREAVPRRVSLAANSVLQSATRPAGSGSGTATLLSHADAAVGVAVGAGVTVYVCVAVGGAGVTVCVCVAVGGAGVTVGVAVAIGVGVAVATDIAVGVAVADVPPPSPPPGPGFWGGVHGSLTHTGVFVDCAATGAGAPETMWPLMVKTAQHKTKADRMTRTGIRRFALSTCERL